MDPLRVLERLWPVMHWLVRGHTIVYRATGGRIGHRFPGSPPMLLLNATGAKSGAKRTTPLVYVADGENIVVVASKAGHRMHPAWFHNLCANSRATIQIGTDRRTVRARVATPEERARLWPRAVDTYRPFRRYQQGTEREIPLVVLTPDPS